MTGQPNIVRMHTVKEIEAEAAAWLARLEDGEASDEDIAAFNAWRNRSEANREAYDRLAALWGAFDRAEELADYAAAAAETGRREEWGAMGRRRAVYAVAASLALIAGIDVVWRALETSRLSHHVIYQTGLGEQREVTLPDGSAIELNTASRIEVDYGRDARTIRLTKGEAFFEVAKNQRRPFSVYAGGGVVTAVGTAFSVRVDDGAALGVLVSEGRVALAVQTPDGDSAARKKKRPPDPVIEVSRGQAVVTRFPLILSPQSMRLSDWILRSLGIRRLRREHP